jgi:cell division septum initiation protein DivIVA
VARHSDLSSEDAGQESGAAGSAEEVAALTRRPNLSGDLESMLVTTPVFNKRPLGYDRLQVDNYVLWAEGEILIARRETDDLVARYGRCCAELELARQALPHSPEGQHMSHVSARIGSMLQLAADEAAGITSTAVAEAERVQREARADADRLRRAAEADRAEAAAARQQAMIDVAEQVKQAGEERQRLDEEAAKTRAALDDEAAQARQRLDREAVGRRDRDAIEAAERVRQQVEAAREEREAAETAGQERQARVEAQIAELERRRDIARTVLVRMSDQVSEAEDALAACLPAPGPRLAPPQPATS